jgi:hypothetical protein
LNIVGPKVLGRIGGVRAGRDVDAIGEGDVEGEGLRERVGEGDWDEDSNWMEEV